MKFSRFMFILIGLLVVSGMVGCTASVPPEVPAGKLTLEQIAPKADSILVGKVTDVTYYQEGEGAIYTQVTLYAEQTIKGETGMEVVVRVPGGKVDGLEMMVTDTPGFDLGESAVVFLQRNDEGIFTVVGGFQGKFTIDNNMVGDKTLAKFIDQIRDILSRQ
jgi:hypothetical protein